MEYEKRKSKAQSTAIGVLILATGIMIGTMVGNVIARKQQTQQFDDILEKTKLLRQQTNEVKQRLESLKEDLDRWDVQAKN